MTDQSSLFTAIEIEPNPRFFPKKSMKIDHSLKSQIVTALVWI